jgi:prevent-host-death family protein
VHKRKPHKRKARVGIRDLRSNLSGYVKRARNGQIIEVTSRDEVVAELRPAFPMLKESRRKPGTLKGRIKIAPDFDTLPDELVDAFES